MYLFRRLRFELERQNLRPLGERIGDQRVHIGRRRRQRLGITHQFEAPHSRIAQNRRQARDRRLVVIQRIQVQQLGLGQIDVGKTQIKLGLQLTLRKCRHLIREQLPRRYSLLRHSQNGMCLLRVVERLVHSREHILLGRNRALLVRPGLQPRARQ